MDKKLDVIIEHLAAIRSTLERINESVHEIGKHHDCQTYDEVYPEAKKIVIENGQASPALLQRKLKIGYMRAAGLMDMLEEDGVVGPPNGAKPRKVLKNAPIKP